jgi:hypothetical protein
VAIYPDRKSALDDAYALALAHFPDSPARARGIEVGERAAAQLIAWRTADDGWLAVCDHGNVLAAARIEESAVMVDRSFCQTNGNERNSQLFAAAGHYRARSTLIIHWTERDLNYGELSYRFTAGDTLADARYR